MSLLATVCDEMGLQFTNNTALTLPQKWTDFLSMKDEELKQCKDDILKELNLDSNTVDKLWFNMHYLSLYQHFNIVRFILFAIHPHNNQNKIKKTKQNVLSVIFNSFHRTIKYAQV